MSFINVEHNDEDPSEVLWKSTKIAGAAVLGAEIGLIVRGLGGAILVPLVTGGAAKLSGLSNKESKDAGVWAGGRLVPK